MASGVFTPYSTGQEFFGAKPSWIPEELDILRIQSYQTYEQMYWNVPDIFKVSIRGTNELPVYIPSTRTIVDTTHRYYGADFKVVTSDRITGSSSESSTAARMALDDFFKRERVKSKLNGVRRYTLIHGDSIWHLTADVDKPGGTRISLTALDPGMYFPIPDEDDVDKIVGCHLVETMSTPDGERIRRVTYRKTENGRITVEDGIFALDKWQGPEATPQKVLRDVEELPPIITSLPVYHVKNTDEPGNPFGSSEVRGLERIMGAVNQTVSDEDLALALMGIGMYATDASEPIDPRTRQPVPWRLGPGRVVHHDGTNFSRVQGVGNLSESYGAHYDRLWQALRQASSTPDVAIGNVDVQVAQSGISLALQMSPMLAKASEKNDVLLDTMNQLFFDLMNMWFPAYEQTTFDNLAVNCTVGSGVPVDREARFAELNDMLDRGVIDTDYYRSEAKKMGYVFPDGIGATANAEWERRQAMSDGFADRVNEELGDTDAPEA